MRLRIVSLIAASVYLLSGCATGQMEETAAAAEGTAINTPRSYEIGIEEYSAGDSEYTGFYNNFEFKATILNTPIRERTHKRQETYFQWDENKSASERAKYTQELSSETKVFVSFFTPDRKNDNLTEDKSIWRVYLDVGGQRYQGEVKRVRTLLAELQSLYPYHTRWNTSYMFHFKIPTTAIESQPSKLTITGPLGTRDVSFPGVK
ncbi:MAG: hypothetical protein V4692_09450 [Bdellovibrionota bacterium]